MSSIYKTLAFMACIVTTTGFADNINSSEQSANPEEKYLEFRIDMTTLKNSSAGKPGGPGAPGAPSAPSVGNPATGGEGAASGEAKVDYSKGSNPASYELKKQYRTAFPQKGQVGPFTKIYDNQTLLISTYETYTGAPGSETLVDSGVHVGLGKPLSSKSDACNADKLDSRTTFFLFGKNGILGVIFLSKSLYNEPNNFDIIMNTGIYSNWKAAKSTQVLIDCRADQDQWIFKGKVRLNSDEAK